MITTHGYAPTSSSRCRCAALIVLSMFCCACASMGSNGAVAKNDPPRQWAAHGYLQPTPEGDGDVIGIFDSLDDCRDAADDWTTRQVVGNPVIAECYAVDTR